MEEAGMREIFIFNFAVRDSGLSRLFTLYREGEHTRFTIQIGEN